MENQPVKPEEESFADNNVGTVGRETEQEKGKGIVVSEHHSPNPTGYAENEENHRTRFQTHIPDEEPHDSINDK